MADPRPPSHWATAPFGRVGHMLGWRWVFFFTFPIPHHPWLARALPFLIAAALAWHAFGGSAIRWTGPLWVALLLAIPLSIPIVQWVARAFMLHLIQSAMLPSAMLLLAVAVARGDEPRWLAMLPASFFGTHLVMAALGRWQISRLSLATETIDQAGAGSAELPDVVLSGRLVSGVDEVMNQLRLPALFIQEGEALRMHVRVDPAADPERLRPFAALPGVSSPRMSDGFLVIDFLVDQPPPVHVAVGTHTPSRPLAAQGTAAIVSAYLPDGSRRSYATGPLAPVSWYPGFVFLLWLNWGQPMRFQAHIGFVRARERRAGRERSISGAAIALLRSLGTPRGSAEAWVSAEAAEALLLQRRDELARQELEALDEMLADPNDLARFAALPMVPELFTDRAPRLVAALEEARDGRIEWRVLALARLIAKLSRPAFQAIGPALLPILASPLMAGGEIARMVRVNGRLEIPARLPPFSGHRLLDEVPELYARLGELGEPARSIIHDLAAAHGWRSCLKRALLELGGWPR